MGEEIMIYTGLLCHALFYKQEATLPAFVKYLAKLRKLNDLPATSDDAYDYRAVLRALVAYYDEHNQLPPDRRALLEYQHISMDHPIRTNSMIGDAVKSLKDGFDEQELKSITDPTLLVTKVIEDAQKEFLDYQMIVARGMMNSGPTKQEGRFKAGAGLDDAKAMLIKTLVDLNDESEDDPDPNEFLLTGGDDPSQHRCVRASDVDDEPLEWLWLNKIPKSKATLFVGKPDNGKSLAVVDLIARVTTGRDFPDGEKNTLGPREVMYAFTEDDEKQTVIPRLKAAQADLTKVIFHHTVVDAEGVKRELSLQDDAATLRKKLIANPDIVLLVLDPITAFVGDADINHGKEIRPVLQALKKALEKSDVTCVGVIHCNKRSDVDALGKILGDSAVAGVCRAAWDFSRDPDNKDEFMMTHIKGNLSKKRSGMRYATEGVMITLSSGKQQEHPHIKWLAECEEDANEMLNKTREKAKSGGEDTKKILAKALLNTMLESVGAYARDIFTKANDSEGLSEATIKRASYEMGVRKERRPEGWWWSLPANVDAITQRVEVKMVDQKVM
jgi:arsenate reductase-like glutaredoxin family protein